MYVNTGSSIIRHSRQPKGDVHQLMDELRRMWYIGTLAQGKIIWQRGGMKCRYMLQDDP